MGFIEKPEIVTTQCPNAMFVKTLYAALVGVDARLVTVEVSVEKGSSFVIVGLPDAAVRESYERIMTATRASGYNVFGRLDCD